MLSCPACLRRRIKYRSAAIFIWHSSQAVNKLHFICFLFSITLPKLADGSSEWVTSGLVPLPDNWVKDDTFLVRQRTAKQFKGETLIPWWVSFQDRISEGMPQGSQVSWWKNWRGEFLKNNHLKTLCPACQQSHTAADTVTSQRAAAESSDCVNTTRVWFANGFLDTSEKCI